MALAAPGLRAGSESAHVAVLDRHPVVALGVVTSLVRTGVDVDLCAAAASWPELEDKLVEAECTPDVVLVDVHLDGGSRLGEVIAQLTARGVDVVLFTSDSRPVLVREAVTAGAKGLILKSDPVACITATLDRLGDSPFVTSSEGARRIVEECARVPHLGPRELEIMRLLNTGLARSAVARRITSRGGTPLTVGTVNTYVNRVVVKYRKAGFAAGSIVEVLGIMRRQGYIVDEPY